MVVFILNENVTNFNRKWSTHDIMVTAILSIVLGLLNIPLTYLGSYLIAFPIVFPIMMGIGFFPLILVAYLIRKPGSVLLSSFIIMAVGVPFTPYGVVMLGQVLMYGLPLEIVFLLGRYRHFESWFMGAQHIARKALGHGVLGGREGHGDDAVATADQTGNGAAAAQLGIIGVRGKYQHVAGTPGRKKLVDVHCCDSWWDRHALRRTGLVMTARRLPYHAP